VASRVVSIHFPPLGFQKLTVSSSAVGLTVPTTDPKAVVRSAHFTVETANIRMRYDGSDPTTDTGELLYVGDVVELSNIEMVSDVKFIAVSSDGVIQIHYHGEH
jgi:hypothetical protein